jgi:hypothetical protein
VGFGPRDVHDNSVRSLYVPLVEEGRALRVWFLALLMVVVGCSLAWQHRLLSARMDEIDSVVRRRVEYRAQIYNPGTESVLIRVVMSGSDVLVQVPGRRWVTVPDTVRSN